MDTRSVPIYNNTQSYAITFRISRYPFATLGQKIRKWRLEHGFFQKDLAKMVGVDEMTIVNWEKDKTAPVPSKLKDLIIIMKS